MVWDQGLNRHTAAAMGQPIFANLSATLRGLSCFQVGMDRLKFPSRCISARQRGCSPIQKLTVTNPGCCSEGNRSRTT